MHDYHDGLPGFAPAQILHDGCQECEQRSKNTDGGLVHLDRQNFALAWQRAAQWNRTGLRDLSRAEIPALTILWSIQIKLEQYGVPVGEVPHGVQ